MCIVCVSVKMFSYVCVCPFCLCIVCVCVCVSVCVSVCVCVCAHTYKCVCVLLKEMSTRKIWGMCISTHFILTVYPYLPNLCCVHNLLMIVMILMSKCHWPCISVTIHGLSLKGKS